VATDATLFSNDPGNMLQSPINELVDKTNVLAGADLGAISCVWTDFYPTGMQANKLNCSNWTLDVSTIQGNIGLLSEADGKWATFSSAPCNSMCYVYCIQTN
jgi:hypothetical protein